MTATKATPRAVGSMDCLYTTVQNISGKEAVFSFIPPHGQPHGRRRAC